MQNDLSQASDYAEIGWTSISIWRLCDMKFESSRQGVIIIYTEQRRTEALTYKNTYISGCYFNEL